MSFALLLYICPGLTSGLEVTNFFVEPMAPLQRSVKMRVVCTWGFVLGVDIG
jgi:hypothetical protein